MQAGYLVKVGVRAILAALSISVAVPLSAEPLRFSNAPALNSVATVPVAMGAKVQNPKPSAAKPTPVIPKLRLPTLQTWMNSEISTAWAAGYQGQGTTITLIDDYSSRNFYAGNLGNGVQSLRHGEWTRLESNMIAPLATIASKDFGSGTKVALAAKGLNVLNLSYGMYASSHYNLSQIGWSAQETSIIDYARNGTAVIAKAAGNDAVAVGAANSAQNIDFLDSALIGTQSAIFVGALSKNGTTASQASLASYSNYAGTNASVQSKFLVVGVEGSKTGLYGTSFAAPVVAGYAAVLGSKFTNATPTEITNQLLRTARKDTILGYDVTKHGQGEASIARALAPISIR
jgi:subtilisin family serine protease